MRRTLPGVLLLWATTTCEGGLQPQPICGPNFVGMCGTVQFAGMPPITTEQIFVLAFPMFPQSCADLLELPPKFLPLPPPALPRPYAGSASYTLALPPGRYEWILAVWKKVGPLTFTVEDTALFREAGHYRDPSDMTKPGTVQVPGGAAVGSIDFTVDFDNLRPVSDFVACTGQ